MLLQKSFLIALACLVFGFTATVLMAQPALDTRPVENLGTDANLVVTSVSGPTTALLNQTISLTCTVRNEGTTASDAFTISFYLSADKIIDPSTDRLLGSVTISIGLAPGTRKKITKKVLVPIKASSGKYYYGAVLASSKKASSKQVAVSRFTVGDNNETLTDHKAGLIWQRNDDGETRKWEAAKQYCQDLKLAGYDDWGLPTIEELFDLADRSRFDPAIDPVLGFSSDEYWSSSPSTGNLDKAWLVAFHHGTAILDIKLNSHYSRCRRGDAENLAFSTLPGAPTGATATAGDAQATVDFTAPLSTGGSPITSYRVKANPGGKTATGTSSPITVTGLTNGTAYTFTVTAANAVGTGPASASSNSVTPAGSGTLPGAPTAVTASPGHGQATVSFGAPVSDGGSPITMYTVTSNPGGKTATGTSSPVTVTGLTNGTAYTFTVKATNGVGSGPASSPSNSVTPIAPATVPGAPTAVAATAGNAQATVSFGAPVSDGGSPIIMYTVISSPGGITKTGTSSPITVTGLTNGTAYTFTVRAKNSVGTGPPSSSSNTTTPVVPATVPGAPTEVTATAGNAQAMVIFAAPVSSGESAIISYTVTSNPGGITKTGASSPITVTELTNGTAYTFTVKATNVVGTGPASNPSNSVTPATVPGAPTGVTATAGNAQATVSFMAPASDGGSSIISYTVTSNPGEKTATGTSSPITVTGLTNVTAYTFTVKATNAVGAGPTSTPSNSVTPVDPDKTFSVSGRVTTNTGTGISGVTMTFSQVIESGTVPVTVTTTDSNGNWSQAGFVKDVTFWVTPSGGYTFIPASMNFSVTRNDLNFTSRNVNNGDGTVTDIKTGLMWQKGDDGVMRGLAAGAQYCENLVLGGYGDWRMPRIDELETIMDYSRKHPAIDPVFDAHTDGYWSESACVINWGSNPNLAWYVVFGNGTVDTTINTHNLYIRCVRGGPFWPLDPSGHLSPNIDTVQDTLNGYIWQRSTDTIGRSTWQEAQAYCNGLDLGGQSDWRLPTIEELMTIIKYDRYYPALSEDVWQNPLSQDYWSSSTNAKDPTFAWIVSFDTGRVYAYYKTYYHCVRCVRGGP